MHTTLLRIACLISAWLFIVKIAVVSSIKYACVYCVQWPFCVCAHCLLLCLYVCKFVCVGCCCRFFIIFCRCFWNVPPPFYVETCCVCEHFLLHPSLWIIGNGFNPVNVTRKNSLSTLLIHPVKWHQSVNERYRRGNALSLRSILISPIFLSFPLCHRHACIPKCIV